MDHARPVRLCDDASGELFWPFSKISADYDGFKELLTVCHPAGRFIHDLLLVVLVSTWPLVKIECSVR